MFYYHISLLNERRMDYKGRNKSTSFCLERQFRLKTFFKEREKIKCCKSKYCNFRGSSRFLKEYVMHISFIVI